MKFSRSTAHVLALLCAATHAQPIKSCDEFAIRLPNVNRTLCEFAQLRPSGVKSVRGRPLLVRDVKPDDARLRVLVVGLVIRPTTAVARLLGIPISERM